LDEKGDEKMLGKEGLLDKLCSILAKANIESEITQIESIIIIDSFKKGYSEATKMCRELGGLI